MTEQVGPRTVTVCWGCKYHEAPSDGDTWNWCQHPEANSGDPCAEWKSAISITPEWCPVIKAENAKPATEATHD